jgi:hypothetical protein
VETYAALAKMNSAIWKLRDDATHGLNMGFVCSSVAWDDDIQERS